MVFNITLDTIKELKKIGHRNIKNVTTYNYVIESRYNLIIVYVTATYHYKSNI